ncbi:hypothetical protein B932_3772 (plasmid) [Gluconobacter oxydans H24]|nr:hypothetical protein B932_3772 [Gluconobacter oxydans H24]
MIVPDLLKTQSESHPRSHQSARQNSEIRSQTHQSTVLRSLQLQVCLRLISDIQADVTASRKPTLLGE